MIKDRPAILFCESENQGACNFYRIRQPASKMFEFDLFPCAMSKDLSNSDFEIWLDKADMIVTKVATPKLHRFLKEKHTHKVVMDFDDNIFAVDPFNPAYEKRGIKEVDYQIPGGKVIKLRDGDGDFHIDENKQGLALYRECIEMSDLILTPSSILGGFLKRWNKNVKVIKNFLDFSVWYPLNLKKDGYVRIGYQGGYAHFQDFWEIRDVLYEIMHKHKNTKLVLMGQVYEGALHGFPEERIERHGWTGMEAYPWKFKSLNIDIGLAPLCETEFNICKSELKWEEYSALGIPTVASNIPPYSLNMKDMINGYLCEGDQEWMNTLSALVESQEIREMIGKTSREHVKALYDLNKGIHRYKEAFNSLFGMKELILA